MHRLKLKSLHRFTSTATAVEEISAIQEGKLGKGLKQFLSEQIVDKGKRKEQLLVSDTKLGEVFLRLVRSCCLCCVLTTIVSEFYYKKTWDQSTC